MKLSEKIGRLFKLTVFSEPHKISFKQAEDNFQNRFQGEFKLTPYFWIFFSQSDSFKTFFFFQNDTNYMFLQSKSLSMIYKSVYLCGFLFIQIWEGGNVYLAYYKFSMNLVKLPKFMYAKKKHGEFPQSCSNMT